MRSEKKESLAEIADRVVPFPAAARQAGIDAGGRAKAHCPFGVTHDDGGAEQSFRVYPDHGYCFAGCGYFTVTMLLAAVREVTREDAAVAALRDFGWKPAGYAHLWADAVREPEPDRAALRAALDVWCAARCPDWGRRQYEEKTADRLARCSGLLRLVRTPADCETWLAAAKRAMEPYLS